MSSELPPETLKHLGGQPPKSEFDMAELERLAKLNATPVGVPLHHSQIEADRPVETTGVELKGLDDGRAWFFLAFLYEFLQLELDLFEVFYAAGNLSRDVKNVVVTKSFVRRGAQLPRGDYPMMHILQGIPMAQGQRFVDFLTTYRFHKAAQEFGGFIKPAQDWCCNFSQVRIADPTVEYRRAVPVWFAMPANLTSKLEVSLVTAPGFLLDAPLFGITKSEKLHAP